MLDMLNQEEIRKNKLSVNVSKGTEDSTKVKAYAYISFSRYCAFLVVRLRKALCWRIWSFVGLQSVFDKEETLMRQWEQPTKSKQPCKQYILIIKKVHFNKPKPMSITVKLNKKTEEHLVFCGATEFCSPLVSKGNK